jgi:type II secretory pathway component PulF
LLLRQVIGNLAYPAFLFHFAIFIMPFPTLFLSGNVIEYLRATLGILIPVYVIVGILIFASQSRHGEWWRSIVESVTAIIPVLGRARRNLALARLAMALEALVSAGLSIIRAWPMAAAASGSPTIRRCVARFKEPLENGSTPSELVQQGGLFPDVFADLYRTGEISGRLEEALQRLAQYYSEEGERLMRMFAQWVPRLVYVGVVIMIAYHVISFYTNYFGQIGQLLQ